MRTFSARETEWLQELDGIELAGFWQRAIAFLVDWMLIAITLSLVASAIVFGISVYMHRQGKTLGDFFSSMATETEDCKPSAKKADKDFNIVIGPGGPMKEATAKDDKSFRGELINGITDIAVPVLYFGILLWKGKGRTPGKRLTKIRVMSIAHRHLSFWHCVERALGYGAAALEGGFGFIQFFLHPYRRCAQDRLAETIVVTEASYQALQHRLAHPLVPDGAPDAPAEDA